MNGKVGFGYIYDFRNPPRVGAACDAALFRND